MSERYTATICSANGASVFPELQRDLGATTDIDAIKEAVEWSRSLDGLEPDARLVVRRGVTSIYFQPVG
jgi:hypothetical protein